MNSINPEWEISVQDTKSQLADNPEFVLIDVRQPEEYRICRIPGAHLFPMSELPQKIDAIRELAEGKTIVAHCHHGGRSLNAAAILREAGLGPVKSMAGGIDLWSLQIDPSVARY
jgi:rhodanese-related sulfurtransferase